ncbi:hypothetical protein [Nocardia sp. BMG111209]|uniref:hypothetical protein n=1 Tax=Nocardia sp. BMG111209 TaxID=1160137 RepID=UPI0012DD99D1|nr:hypothetical protein [Nocardia sp. BMG111209]
MPGRRLGAGGARTPWWRIAVAASAAVLFVVVGLLVAFRVPPAAAPAPDERPIVPLPAVTSLLPAPPVAGVPADRPQPW